MAVVFKSNICFLLLFVCLFFFYYYYKRGRFTFVRIKQFFFSWFVISIRFTLIIVLDQLLRFASLSFQWKVFLKFRLHFDSSTSSDLLTLHIFFIRVINFISRKYLCNYTLVISFFYNLLY